MSSQNACNLSVIMRVNNRHQKTLPVMHIVPLSYWCPSQFYNVSLLCIGMITPTHRLKYLAQHARQIPAYSIAISVSRKHRPYSPARLILSLRLSAFNSVLAHCQSFMAVCEAGESEWGMISFIPTILHLTHCVCILLPQWQFLSQDPWLSQNLCLHCTHILLLT